MKHLRFLPLAYIADVHGFALFASYLVIVVVAVAVSRLKDLPL
jgi:hypothetical protein